jgi:ATP-dependent DNA ligase
VQLLTRTGLDWTDKHPSAIAAFANVKTAYLDGELCGVNDSGLPSFVQTQAATDGERGVRLAYYAFDLLHLDSQDISGLQLVERKALLEPWSQASQAFSSTAMRPAMPNSSSSTPASLF